MVSQITICRVVYIGYMLAFGKTKNLEHLDKLQVVLVEVSASVCTLEERLCTNEQLKVETT